MLNGSDTMDCRVPPGSAWMMCGVVGDESGVVDGRMTG